MGCVSYVVIEGGGVKAEKAEKGEGRVQFVEEKCRKGVRSSDGESKV